MFIKIEAAQGGGKTVLINHLVNHFFAGKTFIHCNDTDGLELSLNDQIDGVVFDGVLLGPAESEYLKSVHARYSKLIPGFVLIQANQIHL